MNIFVGSFFTAFDGNYHNKNVLMNLHFCMANNQSEASSCSAMKNCFNELNRGRRSLKDEIRKGPTKTHVVPEEIDVVRELRMQDRHVTFREIEPYLDISSTSIHSILH